MLPTHHGYQMKEIFMAQHPLKPQSRAEYEVFCHDENEVMRQQFDISHQYIWNQPRLASKWQDRIIKVLVSRGWQGPTLRATPRQQLGVLVALRNRQSGELYFGWSLCRQGPGRKRDTFSREIGLNLAIRNALQAGVGTWTWESGMLTNELPARTREEIKTQYARFQDRHRLRQAQRAAEELARQQQQELLSPMPAGGNVELSA